VRNRTSAQQLAAAIEDWRRVGNIRIAAELHGMNHQQLRYHLQRLELVAKGPARGSGPRKAIDDAEVCRLYTVERLSLDAIGKRFGVSSGTIRSRLSAAGIGRRSPSDYPEICSAAHEAIRAKARRDAAAYSELVDQGLSTIRIAERFGCHRATVANRLRQSGFRWCQRTLTWERVRDNEHGPLLAA
jgi:hypothetical protein